MEIIKTTLKCTLEDILFGTVFFVDDVPIKYPHYFTSHLLVNTQDKVIIVTFNLTTNIYNGFRFVPDLNGLCVTISTTGIDITKKDLDVLTPYGTKRLVPSFIDHNEKVACFNNQGFLYMSPISNDEIRASLLMVPFN